MAIRTEAEITVSRPRNEVFEFISKAERLPEYVDDFERVTHEEPGEPARGHVYSYKMKRGTEGTFEWKEFHPYDALAWSGPKVQQGAGSLRMSGRWELKEDGPGTRVRLVMEPEPGGIFKLFAPLMKVQMSKGNTRALQNLKRIMEADAA